MDSDGDNLSAPKMNEDYSNLTLHYENDDPHCEPNVDHTLFMALWNYQRSELKLFYKHLKIFCEQFGMSLEDKIIGTIIHESTHPIIRRFLLMDRPRYKDDNFSIHIPHLAGLDLHDGMWNQCNTDWHPLIQYLNESGIVRESGRFNIMNT